MNYTATCQGKKSQVKVEDSGSGRYRVNLDGESYEVDFSNPQERTYSLIIDQQSYEVDISVKEANSYSIQLKSEHYNVAIVDERKRKLAEKMASVSSGRQEIKSPMAGNIWKVQKKQGDRVKKGEVLLILEAMKMENEICSPIDGIVTSMNALENGSVAAGALLCLLDQSED